MFVIDKLAGFENGLKVLQVFRKLQKPQIHSTGKYSGYDFIFIYFLRNKNHFKLLFLSLVEKL